MSHITRELFARQHFLGSQKWLIRSRLSGIDVLKPRVTACARHLLYSEFGRKGCLMPADLAWKSHLQTAELPAPGANGHTLLPPLLAKQVLRATSLTQEPAEINAAAQAHLQ